MIFTRNEVEYEKLVDCLRQDERSNGRSEWYPNLDKAIETAAEWIKSPMEEYVNSINKLTWGMPVKVHYNAFLRQVTFTAKNGARLVVTADGV